MLRSLAVAVVAGCVIFHRRQLLLREREPRIPPLPIFFGGPLHRLPIPGHLHPSLFVLRVRPAPARAGQRTGHATGHQLHDLRFADLASGVHRHTGGDACAGRDAQGAPASHSCSRVWLAMSSRVYARESRTTKSISIDISENLGSREIRAGNTQ